MRLPLRRRLLLLSVLAAGGSVAFLPFLAAGSHQPIGQLGGFVATVTVVATAMSWPGLRCADAVGLPMPYLRRLDGGAVPSVTRAALMTTLVLGVALGVFGVLALHLASAPALPGGVWARALSALFAAAPLEMVLHLGVMSIVVWAARGRRGVGIGAAALALIGFHLTGDTLHQPATVLAATVVGNGVIGLTLGWIYATYGFEFVMLGHAVAHLITVLGGA